ncbi:MAG: pentapeptide repeat-containing protein [Acidobacteriota bacterium]|nr:pentapeptide repeat-containing protein [Acidobacteriota bacterium]
MDRDGARLIADSDFADCTFDNCAFSLTQDLLRRSTIRNVTFTNTIALNCNVGPAIIEDVSVDGLETGDILLAWSPFLKHVVFKARMGTIKINNVPAVANTSADIVDAFSMARREFYGDVDWALDISEAVFRDFTTRGIPASLIRRDPATQVVVRREKAERQEWRTRVSPSASYWLDVIDIFLAREGDDDHVLVAPKAIPRKRHLDLVHGLRQLQDLGIAEPD